jgi:CMP-N-acetylneuraminic acid synthetase
MINNKHCYIILTSREDSDRLQHKVIADCAGKPVAKWVVDECHKSKYADEIYHVTSSPLYADIFRKWKCKTIMEPDYLSNPDVPILSVIKYAAEQIESKDDDYFIWVDITKPLTKAGHIDLCIDFADNRNLDSVFTVKKCRSGIVGTDWGDLAVTTQNKPPEKYYLFFGAVRLRTKKTILSAQPGTWGKGTNHLDLPICCDWEVDIDFPHDLIIARALLEAGY